MRDNATTHWQRGVTVAALVLAWALLAAWQWQEYCVECEVARDSVRRQAESIMNALVGGVQSHRRLGHFIEEQLQGLLDELGKSQDVLAVAVESSDKRLSLSAGTASLLNLTSAIQPGQFWEDAGFRYAVAFQITPEMPIPGMGPPGPMGPPGSGGPPGAMGPLDNSRHPEPAVDNDFRGRRPEFRPDETGPNDEKPEDAKDISKGKDVSRPSTPSTTAEAAKKSSTSSADADNLPSKSPKPNTEPSNGRRAGRGLGWQRGGMNWQQLNKLPEYLKPPLVGRIFAVLLLDRTRSDQQISHYAWLRIFVVGAGGLVILSVVLAWRATMRLAEAHGRARLLEIETRHLRELSQAAAGLAHETRNPLGLIRGWTQRLAQSLPESPQQRQHAQTVIEECDRVTARINQFLAFARPCEPKKGNVNPSEVVSELAALLEPDLNAKHLTFHSLPSTFHQTIQADRELLRQALFNLFQNAIQFSPDGSSVETAAKSNPNGVLRIEVADHGQGVPPQAIDLLFTPYHTTRSDGTGLGLAIVRRIATAHGWEVGYAPRPGGGSIFWIDIKS